MLKKLIPFARTHLYLGYDWAFFLLLAFLVCVGMYDLWTYNASGRSAWGSLPQVPYFTTLRQARIVSEMVLFLLFAPPLLLAAVRIWNGTYLNAARSNRSRIARVFLLVSICIATGALVLLCNQLERDSGFVLGRGEARYEFESVLVGISRWWLFSIGWWGTALVTLFAPIGIRLLWGDKKPKFLQEYLRRVRNADLSRDFYPAYNPQILHLNAGIAPRTKYVSRSVRALVDQYQQRGPATPEAARLLEQTWKETTDIIRGFFYPAATEDQWDIHLAPGTGRALEIAIRSFKDVTQVVFSPYEHSTETAVGSWIAGTSSIRISHIRLDGFSFEDEWSKQKIKVVNALAYSLLEVEQTSVIVLSEVCWATGLVVPVKEIVQGVTELCAGLERKPLFVIDGAHAVGNMLRPQGLDVADAYIFSGHKWLMAHEPSGIILTPRKRRTFDTPYDAWGTTLPVSTIGITAIASLRASLEMLGALGPAREERSREAVRYFREQAEPVFTIIGADAKMGETNMLSVRPGPSHKWRHLAQSDLQKALKDRKIIATVIPGQDGTLTVRLAFRYFLSRANIDLLSRELMRLVTD